MRKRINNNILKEGPLKIRGKNEIEKNPNSFALCKMTLS
jgi:hypothetical protein